MKLGNSVATLTQPKQKSSLAFKKGCPPVKKLDLYQKIKDKATAALLIRFLIAVPCSKVAFCLHLAFPSKNFPLSTITGNEIKLFQKT